MHASDASLTGEEIRTAATVGLPDPRSTSFVIRAGPDQPWRPVEVEDLCRGAKELALPDSVEIDVKAQFDVALNLFIYSWHVYRFHAVCQLQALRTLELALRRRVPDASRARGMRGLLERALKAGVLHPTDFAGVDAGQTLGSALIDAERQAQGRVPLAQHEHVMEFICAFRNDLAHGEPWLHPNSRLVLSTCASIITAIYGARAT